MQFNYSKFFFFLSLYLLSEPITLLKAEAPEDNYTVSILPSGFSVRGKYPPLNENGQVVGIMNQCAVVWDLKNGLKNFPMNNFKLSFGPINDLGCVAVNCISFNGCEKLPLVLWNTNTNGLVFGPSSIAHIINNKNKVLAESNAIWDSNTNTIKNCSTSAYLDDNDRLYSNSSPYGYVMDFNKKGTLLCQSKGLLLVSNNNSYVVSFPGAAIRKAKLNNKDEVVFIHNNMIIKWSRDKSISHSKILNQIDQLKNISKCEIMGFNSRGQILIQGFISPIRTYSYVLLTPK